MKGEANPALPGTSQRPSPQQGRRPSDLVDFLLPSSLVYVTDSSFNTTTDNPAAILAILPAQRKSDSIATKQNPRLHSADRFLGTKANHPPSARPSLPSRARTTPTQTLESHVRKALKALPLCYKKVFQKLAPRRSNICRPRSTPLPPSSHDCLLLPAEQHHLPCIRKQAPRQLRQNRSGGARAANFRSSTTGNGHAACRACWTGIVLALCPKVTLHHLLCNFLDCFVFVLDFWVRAGRLLAQS